MSKTKIKHKTKKKLNNKLENKLNSKFIFILVIIILIIIVIFTKINYKSEKIGNNISNKTSDEIAEYILNISSYETKIDVKIESNKNSNRYILKQEYSKENHMSKQIVEEPKNIEGLTTKFDGLNLQIENSELGLSKIYENYKELTQNHLLLETFIEDFKNGENKQIEEKDGTIEMKIKLKDESNKYSIYKKLYIDKKTAKPLKLEVQDINQKIRIYILYNEININSVN